MTDAYIFDIDGTVANNTHRTHHLLKKPKDWAAYNAVMELDTPHSHIIALANRLRSDDVKIVFCSGREEPYRAITQGWLYAAGVDFIDGLYMRPTKDYRADSVIKAELLARIKADGFTPLMAFDDRNSVVAMWRANGIPCAQVAEGDF